MVSRLVELLRRLPVTICLTLAVIAVFALQHQLGGATDVRTLVRLGSLHPDRIAAHGEVWRVISAMFLHGGSIHFGFNLLALVQLAALAELIYGSHRLLGFYLVSGLVAGLTSTLMNPAWMLPGVGASGALYGLVGVLMGTAMFGPPELREALERPRRALSLAVSFGFSLWVADWFFSLPILVDHWAHAGGFVTGLLLAAATPDPVGPPQPFESSLAYVTTGAFVGAALAVGVFGDDALEQLPDDVAWSLQARLDEAQSPLGEATVIAVAPLMLQQVEHPDRSGVFRELIADAPADALREAVIALYSEPEYHHEAVVLHEQLHRLEPQSPANGNALAWLLLTYPTESDRQPQRALEVVEQALAQLEALSEDEVAEVTTQAASVDLALWLQRIDLDTSKVAQTSMFLDTRAEALFQLGRVQEALTDQREAVDLGESIELDSLPEMRERLARIEAAI